MTEILIYRSESICLQKKSMDWFVYVKDFHHERVNGLCNRSKQVSIFVTKCLRQNGSKKGLNLLSFQRQSVADILQNESKMFCKKKCS